MHKIMFVCHGNICRSTMAEFVMKHIVRQRGREADFLIESTATSLEEIGNDTHPGTKRKLTQEGIPFSRRAARRITRHDCETFDMIIAMDQENLWGLHRLFGNEFNGKIHLLLDFADSDHSEVADPWYTGNFDETYEDVIAGCMGLWDQLS